VTKTLIPTILAILRQFHVADDESTQRSVSNAKEQQPRQFTNLISFIFNQTKYYIIFDDNADDDKEHLKELIAFDRSDIKGHFVQNPRDESKTYGMPFKGKVVYLFQIVSEKKRLDLELAERYPDLSRSTIQKYIKAGHVQVNGEVITKAKHDIKDTDDIAMVPPTSTDFSTSEIPILYIDDNVIVINKPAGVLTHSKGAMNDEFTVADFFRRYTTNALETTRPGIVHRLDRDTSGVMIGARNDETALLLKKQFSDRGTKKEYIAIVSGVPKVDHAVIDLPIGRNPSAPSTFRVNVRGKAAITTYEVLATNNDHTLVKLNPKTGRTHQLRVHMEYINTPIWGDRIYGHKKDKADRLYLHAHKLEITIPASRRETFIAPVPKEFTKHFPGVGNV
jgi:23S rRNA pseudouridine1911/1915/1917 synthase